MNETAIAPAPISLQEAYIQFLEGFPFQWFCSMTFHKSVVHPQEADMKWRVWISKLNQHLYGRRWYQKEHTQIFWARALEWQKRHVIHYHALIGDVRDINHQARRLRWMDEWSAIAGYARISEIRTDKDKAIVRRYVTKYVTKGGEIELSPSLRFVQKRGSAQIDL